MTGPVEVSPSGDYSLAARRLVTQPGVWLRINGFDRASRARAFARDIAEGYVGGFDEIVFETQVEARGCDVYARYHGTAKLKDREVSS